MVGWHHRLNGHVFEQTLGDGEGQGSLACCSPWDHKQLDTTERLNNNNNIVQEAVTKVIPKKKKCKKVSGCLRRLYKEPRKEEKRKAKEKRKDKNK